METTLVIAVSFVISGYISIYLERSAVNLSFMLDNAFGIILIIIALVSFFFLFNTAKKDIITKKISIQQAQKKYFEHNPVLTFAMSHYVIGIFDIGLFSGFFYLPIILDHLITITQSYPGNVAKGELDDFIIFIVTLVIPILIIIFTPLSLKKLLSHVNK